MKYVPKRTITRLEEFCEDFELQNIKIMLELCKETDDDLWKQLILLHLDDLQVLNSKEGNRLKTEIRRKLKYGI